MNSVRGTNQDVICTAKTINQYFVREIFNFKKPDGSPIYLCMPIFQRRYCWGHHQLKRFLSDAVRLAPRARVEGWLKSKTGVRYRSYPHSLGTLTCCALPNGNLSIIDGQQRLTTLCLLLSSVRDYLSRLEIAPKLCKAIDQTLFPTGRANGCVVRPTYFDRPSFDRCVNGNLSVRVGPTAAASSSTTTPTTTTPHPPTGDHVLVVRQYFDNYLDSGLLLQRLGPGDDDARTPDAVTGAATKLVGAALDQFSLLWFKMDNKENAQSAYARLAMRAAMLTQLQTNPSAGVAMATADLLRNLVVSYFARDEKVAIAMYLKYWAPVEALSAAAAARVINEGAQKKPTDRGRAAGSKRTRRGRGVMEDAGRRGDKVGGGSRMSAMVYQTNNLIEAFVQRAAPSILQKSKAAAANQWADPAQAMFPGYKMLQHLFHGHLLSQVPDLSDPDAKPDAKPGHTLERQHKIERVVESLLARFVSFANDFFRVREDSMGPPLPRPKLSGPVNPNPNPNRD